MEERKAGDTFDAHLLLLRFILDQTIHFCNIIDIMSHLKLLKVDDDKMREAVFNNDLNLSRKREKIYINEHIIQASDIPLS